MKRLLVLIPIALLLSGCFSQTRSETTKTDRITFQAQVPMVTAEGVKVVPEWLTERGYFCTNLTDLPASFGFRGTGKTDWNFETRGTAFQTGSWEDLPAKRPFLAQINLSETHRPYRGARRVDPATVTLPPYYPDHPVARDDWAGYLNDVLALEFEDRHHPRRRRNGWIRR